MQQELINLVDHDHSWLLGYAAEAFLLREVLSDEIVSIHHVGSTAVPGIKAKPIIDIAVESIVFPASSKVSFLLSQLGYVGGGESGVPGRSWFSKGEPRAFNLH